MALGMGNDGNGGNGSGDVQVGMPTLGAGWTGVNIGTSELGPVGQGKLIIVDDVYSQNGTALERSTGHYVLGQGGAQDIFRDFIGKIWTKTLGASGDPQKLTFLNPKMGADSGDVSTNMPCDIYVDAAMLVGDSGLPEYRQKLFIDPDIEWLYDNIVPELFPDNDFNQQVKDVVLQALSDPTEKLLGVETSIVNKATTIIDQIRTWWMAVLKFEDAPDTLPESAIFNPLIVYGPSYQDYNFEMSTPFSIENAKKMLGLKPLIAHINPVYNFYINEYECRLKQDSFKEQIIPNLYAFISSYIPEDYGNQEHKTSKKFEDLISLGGLLEGYDGSSLVSTPYQFGPGQNLVPAASTNYFRTWTTTLEKADPDQLLILGPLAKRYTNILFPLDNTNMLQYYNKLRFMFPMFNSLKFSTGILTQFGDLFRSSKLAQHFMRFYVSYGDMGLFDASQHSMQDIKKEENFVLQETALSDNGSPTTTTTIINDTKMTVMDLRSWLATMELIDLVPDDNDMIRLAMPPNHEQHFNENAIFMTTNKNEEMINVKSSNELERSILASILYGKIRKIAKSHMRHYSELCKGSGAYSETLMYKVEKWVGDEGQGNKVQTFYFLNSSKLDVLNFIDTQVSYNIRYTYKIAAIQLVVGTEYRYDMAPQFASAKSQTGGYIDLWESAEQKAAAEAWEKQTAGTTGAAGKVGPFHNYADPAVQEIMVNCETPELISPSNPYFGLKDPCGCANILIKENIKQGTDWGPAQFCAASIDACCPDLQPLGDSDSNVPPGHGGNPSGHETSPGTSGAAATPGIMDLIDIGTTLLTAIPVVYKPVFNIVEIPYFTLDGRILDKPPIFPDVNIVPYKGINNKLLVNLNSSVGEYKMMPIAFNGEEEKEFGLIREAQKITDPTGPITFKSDDTIAHGGFFQVYRTDKRPEKYSDFDKHLKHALSSTSLGLRAESVAFVDDIKPNKKYYYTFRVVDTHGNSSNPTEVFEVEMIDDNGTVYFRQRIIELKPLEEKAPYLPLKKYVHIQPSLAQRIINEEGFGNATSAFEFSTLNGNKGPVKLGVQEESLWGKRFKIRFTSKSTGRQVDLNVNFKLTNESQMEKLGNQIKDAQAVEGVQASGGGLVNPIDEVDSGAPAKPLEGW